MIIEEREYKIRIGKMQEFWNLYKDEGLPIQIKYQKNPKGFYSIIIGDTCNFVHMWEYNSLKDMEECKKNLHKDKFWNNYMVKSHNYIESINTRILSQFNY